LIQIKICGANNTGNYLQRRWGHRSRLFKICGHAYSGFLIEIPARHPVV